MKAPNVTQGAIALFTVLCALFFSSFQDNSHYIFTILCLTLSFILAMTLKLDRNRKSLVILVALLISIEIARDYLILWKAPPTLSYLIIIATNYLWIYSILKRAEICRYLYKDGDYTIIKEDGFLISLFKSYSLPLDVILFVEYLLRHIDYLFLDKLLNKLSFDGNAMQIWLFNNADIFYQHYDLLRAVFAGIVFSVLFNMFRINSKETSPS